MTVDLNRCRPLDVHKWSEHSEVNQFLTSIYSAIEETTSLTNTERRLAKVVILDLFVCWKTDPLMVLMFSRDNNAYRSRSRYSSLHIGKKVIGLVDTLVELGFVHQKKGFQDRVSGSAFRSRLWATPLLISLFEGAEISQFAIGDHAGREVIILRDEDKSDTDYNDTEATARSRHIIQRYNELLARTHIDIHTLEGATILVGKGRKQKRLAIGQHAKFVRRIYSNSSLIQGGRFYGGWWQQCPKEQREFIFIDGIYTSEIDYSGIHLVLMYANIEIDYWDEINSDPYEIPAPAWCPPNLDLRSAAKRLLLTAINAADEAKAFKAFRDGAASGSDEKKLTNAQLGELLASLKSKHPKVADQLASGVGIFLMNTESAITEKIIEHFVDLDVPVLTIHDSYIVPLGYEYELEDVMNSAFEVVTGLPNARFDSVGELPHEVHEVPGYEPPETTQRHINSLAAFRQFHGLPDTPAWYEGAVERLHARGIVDLI